MSAQDFATSAPSATGFVNDYYNWNNQSAPTQTAAGQPMPPNPQLAECPVAPPYTVSQNVAYPSPVYYSTNAGTVTIIPAGRQNYRQRYKIILGVVCAIALIAVSTIVTTVLLVNDHPPPVVTTPPWWDGLEHGDITE